MESDKIFLRRRALVVGGTGGLGRALSSALAQNGAELTVIGSKQSSVERAEREAREAGFLLRAASINLEDENAVQKIIACCPEPDILVCAFGPFLRKRLAETSVDDWKRIVTLNLILPGALVSACLNGMIERRWGRILLFGGTNTDTIRGWTTTAPYAAAKTALGTLAKSAAKNAGGAGVCCNVICPGLTDTEYMDEEARRYNRENSPIGRGLLPAEIADFAIEILKNPNLNGAIIPVDNGVVIHVV